MNKLVKQTGIIIVIFIALVAISALFVNPSDSEAPKRVSLAKLVQQIEQQKVEKISVQGNKLSIDYKDDQTGLSRKEDETALSQSLLDLGVEKEALQKVDLEIKKEKEGFMTSFLPIISIILPLILFGAFFFLIFRNLKGKAGKTMSMLKSPAQKFKANQQEKVSFDDIGNLKEAKEEVGEIVDFLKNPDRFLRMGAKIPRGVLLVGPPGSGKTLLARAVANEADVPFYSISGSEFVELFVGVGSRRVKNLFKQAKKNQPAIIYIDELDAIGRMRGTGIGGGHDEREQTLNQILVEMDGFSRESKTIILSSTNRPDILDPALLRPGRFDRRISINLPDVKGRKRILEIHTENKPLSKEMHLQEVAERTPGFSGADLENLANEAAILATRRNHKKIKQKDFLESIDKVMLGPERKSFLLNDKEKKITAYHEAGHALVSSLIEEGEPVRKVSILSRGMGAGYTITRPEEERKLTTRSQFLAKLSVLLAGYTTEQIVFDEISTGAANDLKKATSLARDIVEKYGMSKLGPINFSEGETIFLGKEMSEEKKYSEQTATKIDKEIIRLIKEAQKKAKKIIKNNQDKLDQLAETLIKRETLEKEEFAQMIESGD